MTKQFDQILAQDLPALNDSLKSKANSHCRRPRRKSERLVPQAAGLKRQAANFVPADFRISY